MHRVTFIEISARQQLDLCNRHGRLSHNSKEANDSDTMGSRHRHRPPKEGNWLTASICQFGLTGRFQPEAALSPQAA